MALTLAVLGAGGWGWNWTHRALKDPDVDVVAYADTNPAVLERLAEQGVPRDRLFRDAEQAMAAATTDAVTVTVPNPGRVPLLHRAMEEGRHILVDKPLVHTSGALGKLLREAANRTSVLMVSQNYRFFEGVQAARRLIDGGELGPVGAIHAHFLRNMRADGPSYLWKLPDAIPLGFEMCVHHFDMLRFLLGVDPVWVSAHGWRNPWSPGLGYDSLDVHLEFPGGVHVAYDATWGATHDRTDWPGYWEIVGQRQTVSYGHEGRAWRVLDVGGRGTSSGPGLSTDADTAASNDQVWREFKTAIGRVEAGGPAPGRDFCPIEDNAHTLGICLAVAESINTRSQVDFASFLRENDIPVRDRRQAVDGE